MGPPKFAWLNPLHFLPVWSIFGVGKISLQITLLHLWSMKNMMKCNLSWVGYSCLKVNLQLSHFGPYSGNTMRDQLGCTYLDSDSKTSPWDAQKFPWLTPLDFWPFWSIFGVGKISLQITTLHLWSVKNMMKCNLSRVEQHSCLRDNLEPLNSLSFHLEA